MTIEEKRKFLTHYCVYDCDTCGDCILSGTNGAKWEHIYEDSDEKCLDLDLASEKELDKAIKMVNENYKLYENDAFDNENDPVNPNHYKQGEIECIDALKAATVGKTGIEAVCTANVIKYLWRFEDKNGLEDIKKAKWYVERLIKELEEKD